MKAFYHRAAPFLLAEEVMISMLAILGLYQGGRSVIDSDSVEWRAENLSPRQVGTPVEQAVLESIEEYFLIGYLGLLGLVLLASGARTLNERRGGMITLSYGNGRTVRVPKRLSGLDASRRNNVPPANACGNTLAVRYGFHRQPLPRRGVAGRDRMRRTTEPVRRRRAIGAVRARCRPANRLPPGAQGGSHDRRQCRRAESVSQARSA